MSIATRPEFDEIAEMHGEYLPVAQLSSLLQKNKKIIALCTDGQNYYADVKEFNPKSLMIHLHFRFWSERSDYRGSVKKVFITTDETFVNGINIATNRYITTTTSSSTKADRDRKRNRVKHSFNGEDSRRYEDGFLDKPRLQFGTTRRNRNKGTDEESERSGDEISSLIKLEDEIESKKDQNEIDEQIRSRKKRRGSSETGEEQQSNHDGEDYFSIEAAAIPTPAVSSSSASQMRTHTIIPSHALIPSVLPSIPSKSTSSSLSGGGGGGPSVYLNNQINRPSKTELVEDEDVVHEDEGSPEKLNEDVKESLKIKLNKGVSESEVEAERRNRKASEGEPSPTLSLKLMSSIAASSKHNSPNITPDNHTAENLTETETANQPVIDKTVVEISTNAGDAEKKGPVEVFDLTDEQDNDEDVFHDKGKKSLPNHTHNSAQDQANAVFAKDFLVVSNSILKFCRTALGRDTTPAMKPVLVQHLSDLNNIMKSLQNELGLIKTTTIIDYWMRCMKQEITRQHYVNTIDAMLGVHYKWNGLYDGLELISSSILQSLTTELKRNGVPSKPAALVNVQSTSKPDPKLTAQSTVQPSIQLAQPPQPAQPQPQHAAKPPLQPVASQPVISTQPAVESPLKMEIFGPGPIPRLARPDNMKKLMSGDELKDLVRKAAMLTKSRDGFHSQFFQLVKSNDINDADNGAKLFKAVKLLEIRQEIENLVLKLYK